MSLIPDPWFPIKYETVIIHETNALNKVPTRRVKTLNVHMYLQLRAHKDGKWNFPCVSCRISVLYTAHSDNSMHAPYSILHLHGFCTILVPPRHTFFGRGKGGMLKYRISKPMKINCCTYVAFYRQKNLVSFGFTFEYSLTSPHLFVNPTSTLPAISIRIQIKPN